MGAYGLPALDVKPPQQGPGPLEQYGQLAQLRAMMGQQQLQQQQIQGAQTANQEAQLDLQSRQAFMKAYTESNGDPDKTMQLAAKYGADPKSTIQMQNLFLDQKTKSLQYFMTHGDAAKRDADLMQGAHDTVTAAQPADRPAVYQQQLQALSKQLTDPSQLGQLPQQYPGDDAFRFIGAMVKAHTQQMDELSKQSDINKNTAQAREATASAQQKETQTAAFQGTGLIPGLSPQEQGLISYMRSVPGARPENYPAWQAQQEAKATQPYKAQLAEIEGKTRQLIQGMTEPVYAYGADGQKTLMSKTDALKSGIKTMVPVSEGQVSEDTMLINRLSDVRQKVARYEQNLQKDLKPTDRLAIQGLLEDDKFKMGAFGTEIPVDIINKLADQYHIHNLSPEGRDALISYYNAREALVGYNRVLSGSGRSNEQALQLQMQTLPSPAIADKDFSQRAINQFRENLQIVGQGLPNIPGVKSPEQWEKDMTAPAPQSFDYRRATHMHSLSSLLQY